MEKIKAFILSPITALVCWAALACSDICVFAFGIVAGAPFPVALSVVTAAALALVFAAKLLS